MNQINEGGAPIKAWTQGVQLEDSARKQLVETATLPVVWPHLAVMPDVHWGQGATVGSVIPTRNAIVPSAVGVDIGCGLVALETTLTSKHLGDNGQAILDTVSRAVPHGRSHDGGIGDEGAWAATPDAVGHSWADMAPVFQVVCEKAGRKFDEGRALRQLGTLGGGNHFIEVCLDERDHVWVMLHSGSRGIGNQIGSHFIAAAKDRCSKEGIKLPNADLAWLPTDCPEFHPYITAVDWAQNYALQNRRLMMVAAVSAIEKVLGLPVDGLSKAVECHHNYVAREMHFGEDLYVTRKGAVSARYGELGIIPGAMGGKSYIVRGLGNRDSLHSCSHGAGRVMSRGEAKKKITLERHIEATAGVFCRKDKGVLDESLDAYKDLDSVMEAQRDLVSIVHTLKAVVCVKG